MPTFEDQPPDDPTPNDDGSQPLRIPYDMTNLPQPTRLAAYAGFSSQTLQFFIDRRLEGASAIVNRAFHRPLYPSESDAVAYWTAKEFAIRSWGPVLGHGAGLWRCWSTRKQYRFPFWQPDIVWWRAPERVFGVPVGRVVGNVVWHSLRTGTYLSISGLFGRLLVGVYAMNICMIGEGRDTRLKEFVRAMKMETRRVKGLLKDIAGKREDNLPPEQVGGMGVEESSDADNLNLDSGDRMLSDDQMRGQEARARPTGSRDTEDPPRKIRYPLDKILSRSRSFSESSSPSSDDFIAPESNSEAPPRRRPRADTSGSAWERLRKGASNPSSSSGSAWAKRRSGTPESEDSGVDSFNFSEEKEDRKMSKEEAQREFDEKLERERRGEDFK